MRYRLARKNAFAATLMLLAASSCAPAGQGSAPVLSQANPAESAEPVTIITRTERMPGQLPLMVERPDDLNGFSLFTVELAPDGRIVSCSKSTEGGDAAACAANTRPPSWLAPLAPRYRTIRVQIGARMPPSRPPEPGPDWGKLIASRLSLMTFPYAGTAMSDCRVIASEGEPIAGVDTCSLNPIKPGRRGERVNQMIDGWVLYGIPR